ncbi:hypothetical protein QQG55_34515 [Brugia pahangi]
MKWITVAIYCSYSLVSRKMLMATNIFTRYPYVPEIIDEGRINENERFIFYNTTKKIWTFHRLAFNDSIMIRMDNTYFNYSKSNKNQSFVTFYFLDKDEYEIVHFMFCPGSSEVKLKCIYKPYESAVTMWWFPEYGHLYHEFILLFSSQGIMAFLKEKLYLTSKSCISRIPDITKFKHNSVGIHSLATMVEVRPESARIPSNWHIVKPIPINHKIVIKYYPDKEDEKSIVTIRLTDKNEITALTVIVDHKMGMLLARRVRLDNENIKCVVFARTERIYWSLVGQIEISVFPHQYKVAMRAVRGTFFDMPMDECMVYGHHLSPYDIQQTIFDSTNKRTIFYAYYIEPV